SRRWRRRRCCSAGSDERRETEYPVGNQAGIHAALAAGDCGAVGFPSARMVDWSDGGLADWSDPNPINPPIRHLNQSAIREKLEPLNLARFFVALEDDVPR